ncbi:MAG: hypothetical protein ACRD22_05450 [Terriglobia bacterium]
MKQRDAKVFEVVGVSRTHWSNASPIREIFKDAFEHAELPYFNPHSFRKTLVRLGETICQSAEELKAWSQNMGHKGVLTTLMSYGEVQQNRQAEIFNALRNPRAMSHLPGVADLAKALAREMAAQKRSNG